MSSRNREDEGGRQAHRSFSAGERSFSTDPVSVEKYQLTSKELFERPITPQIFKHVRVVYEPEETLILQVELAFQEALANSFEHGNLELQSEWREQIDAEGKDLFSRVKAERLGDPIYADRPIQIMLGLADDTLTIEIQDNGPGFNYADRSFPAHEEDVKCHGRGLSLMHLVMDSVSYTDRGRHVRLIKKLAQK